MKREGLSITTLLIAGASSAIAAFVVPMIWERGTVFAAAMTPVIVALASEALKRPVDAVSAVRVRRTASGAAILDPVEPPPVSEEPFDPLAPAPTEEIEAALTGAPPPPRTEHRRRRLTGRQWRLAIVTGLIAFFAVAAVVTASELAIFGDSVSSGDRRTTFFGGSESKKSSSDEKKATPTPTETATPAGVGDAEGHGDPDADGHRHPHDHAVAAGPRARGHDHARPQRHADADALSARRAAAGALPISGSMAKDRIPTSRLARTAKVGTLAAGQAARQLGTLTTNIARSDEGKQAALERRHLEAAEQIVAALGTMKGAAMKLGQVMSFLDVGLVPEEYREEFQRKLGELRDSAPKVRFDDMRKVIEGDLGEKLSEAFDAFDEDPIAAASIGQVYRARLHDGRDVAVKVQYPGVAQAVRADMQNLGLILRLMKRVAPGLDVKATAEEIRARIGDELDYELEAQNQRRLARIFRGHPFIVVPEVVTSLSRERVLVSDYVSGAGFDAIKQMDQATRDRVSEMVFRFFFGCMYRHHQFSGDPHPGNFLLMADGRVAFLDFGLFKVMPRELLEIELACQRAGHEGDGEKLKQIWTETGFLQNPDRFRPDKLLAQFRDATWWYVLDEEIALQPEIATQVMIDMSDPRSQHFGQMRHETLPADHLFGRRVEMLTLAVLSQLRARGNFHRIAREWMYGEDPVTELGRQEAAFYAGSRA